MTRPAKRVVSIWWPMLAIERWQRLSGAAPDALVALTLADAHGPRIHAATAAARAAGAQPGMRLTDARALEPSLVAVAADVAGDGALVRRLARWAGRWSPLVQIEGPAGDDAAADHGGEADSPGRHGLRLDATGIAHLFGGEAAMLADIERRFAALGLTARVAIAPTAGAAWALARFAPEPLSLCPEGAAAQALAPLPVAALGLSPAVSRTLSRLGLKTVGTLAGVPRRGLARRFRDADNPLDALDRALGRRSEPLTAAAFEPPPRALLRLTEPVADPAAAPQALALLVPRLVHELAARQLGARRLALTGFRVDGEVATVAAGCALATREEAHLLRLLADKAALLDPGFGFDGFALEASWAEPLAPAQDRLEGGAPPAVAVARLVDRLAVRLGEARVRRPQPHASHLPERASGWRPALAEARPCDPPAAGAARPVRLLDRPEGIAVIYATPEGLPRRFVWRRRVHDIARAEGPERISPEWWREWRPARLRDYYRVEDGAGRRFWIFREGLHGDGRGGEPAWYLHGLFG